MKVKICGIDHEIEYCEDNFDSDAVHLGEIEYKEAKIKINNGMSKDMQNETLCHEIVHGILVHIGYSDLSNDERFVQALGNAISQTFSVNLEEE